ncbi:MAG: hypothetical protein CBB66_04835 [bacterium TMED6]|nr:MAG: hypothetical protein CBB66_04835 [bacterium TMED6]|tara:strand:- start:5108 stop:6136 length:1029 start_codon:yes stop_codon:yes gene_type:complete
MIYIKTDMVINDDGTLLGILLFLNNLLPFILFILGCIFLYYSSESFIDKSILISHKMRISPIIIGASVVALGTSLPELLVSLYSIFSYDDPNNMQNLVSSSIIIGNILGSNIANIALVVGFCAFLYRVIFESDVLKDIIFISFLGIYVLVCMYFNITINYIHGLLLLSSFIFYFYYLIKNNKSEDEIDDNINFNLIYCVFIILVSIVGLSLGTNLVVENALNISKLWGVSELNIGFSIVALGTSLPELFTGLSSIKRKKYNLFIGNIIGSNILNIIFVLGISSLFSDINVSSSLIDGGSIIATVFILSHLILFFNYILKKTVSKISGFLLLLMYFSFLFNLL